jgi:hypothetical protein
MGPAPGNGSQLFPVRAHFLEEFTRTGHFRVAQAILFATGAGRAEGDRLTIFRAIGGAKSVHSLVSKVRRKRLATSAGSLTGNDKDERAVGLQPRANAAGKDCRHSPMAILAPFEVMRRIKWRRENNSTARRTSKALP